MNLIKVISNEEPIGGLEIEDTGLRFSLLKKDRSGLKIKLLVEEKLSDKEGLKSGAAFTAKLLKFAKKNDIKYIIVSIPTDNIFVKTYTFPLAMTDDKIEESMQLTTDLQLPQKKENIYCDWMKTEEKNDKKILLSYIEKTYINELSANAKKAGLKIVAIESRAMSVARAIKQKLDEATLLVERGLTNTTLSVLLNNQVLFSQSAPNNRVGDNLSREINQVINYHSWYNVNIKNLILLGAFSDQEIKKLPLKASDPEIKKEISTAPKDLKWLVSLGAALRGIIARKDDDIISLMEIGTEKAYKREKINSTTTFFISISLALSIFFVAIFFATWSFAAMVQRNYNKQISSFNLLPSSENAAVLREKANTFNSLIAQTSALAKKEPQWSKVLTEAKSKVVSEVIINNFTLPSESGVFILTGTAANRETINRLKASFASSGLFSEVDIPLNNLGKKNDIPFSLSFKVKNRELIYTK